ncbi:TIGR01459 family HAD-type hydrolase [Brevundimonas sp. 2R-24]|uniref:TIGR01459 family HAD-type hydrolase n=1 Tax=Peiella sedimenti TaxID=3061083 RepID=A0ABT8SJ26_9CAUL|nr:TIGR01459 family HAD-type hydrolase [Caulobacteraceae bacterium XZ-24]
MTDQLSGLSRLTGDYDVLLCDVWGVIHNGCERHPAACEALMNWRDQGGAVVLITNAPRPSSDILPQLEALKVPRQVWDGFVSSGDATRAELKARGPAGAWALGPERDLALYEGTGITPLPSADSAAFISCTGLYDDEKDDPQDYREALAACAERGLEMICANPDRKVHRGDHLIWCAGALADVYESLGGKVVMAGKPFAPIYRACLAEAERITGRDVDPARVLCIGDGLPTDVKGGNDQGLDVLFISGGLHRDEGEAAELLERHGLSARWVMPALRW